VLAFAAVLAFTVVLAFTAALAFLSFSAACWGTADSARHGGP